MSQPNSLSLFWIYLSECARLLYWAYFKPFTFRQWLGNNIHATLPDTYNPFSKQRELAQNSPLRRYAYQVWWVNLTVPFLIMLLVAPIYSLASGELFNGLSISLFLLGWVTGLLQVRANFQQRWQWFYSLFITLAIVLFLLLVISQLIPKAEALVQSLFSAPLFSALGLVVWGVSLSVIFGVLWEIAWDMVLSVVLAVIFHIALNVPLSVTFYVALGVGCSVATVGTPYSATLILTSTVVGFVASSVAWGGGAGVAWILGVLRVYFWIPELLWSLALFLVSRPGAVSKTLPYLPPRFDELIYLPLPFLDSLIIESYPENPAAARQTIDYLITSTNQQQLAAKAIRGIALTTLDRCQTITDIVAISNELNWIPSPPPKQLGEILPNFLEISQTVRSTQSSTTAYRQIELLQKPIAALGEIQNRLAFNRNPFLATSFGSITQRWLQILQTACRTLTEAAEKSGEIPQPYIAGSALDPESAKSRFKGRQDLFRQIENLSLSPQPPILLLYGGRRTGKTSTLKYLPQKVGADLVPLLVDIQGIASTITLSGFAKSLATAIQKAAWHSRRLQLPQPDLEELQTDPFLALQTWFTQIERMASGKRFLLCLDEFERLEELIAQTKSRAPLNFLRHLMQHCPQWILLFSGSHTPDELDPYWSDYLINTQSLRLTYLEEPEARELILKPVENFPDIYHPQAVDRIIELTACQPYLVQLTCSLVVDRLNQKSRDDTQKAIPSLKATREDIDGVIPKVLERGGTYFRELWTNTLSQREQNFIQDLMAGTVDAGNQRLIRQLIKKQVIAEGEKGNYQVKVPLIQHYFESVLTDDYPNS
ncbi:hypothetical protein [Laspinema palackyanum]|uniref:hypothetical protein n=1 Tax=Laspinema palackyanum TaxID=3231601 RepID=UPI00345D1D88|nr:ATP-binding protein [Laspinema sp. D2c]